MQHGYNIDCLSSWSGSTDVHAGVAGQRLFEPKNCSLLASLSVSIAVPSKVLSANSSRGPWLSTESGKRQCLPQLQI